MDISKQEKEMRKDLKHIARLLGKFLGHMEHFPGALDEPRQQALIVLQDYHRTLLEALKQPSPQVTQRKHND
jgi:hypothetical protein